MSKVKSEDVLAWINRQSESFTTIELAGRFAMKTPAANQLLSRLFRDRQVHRLGFGLYTRLPPEKKP